MNWILNLTSSAFFSILVNGVPSRPFSPSIGIRQGDPLSTFLFVLMVEGVGRYIKSTVTEGSLKGLPLHNIQPTPSHSQFVDDTLLLNSPTVQEASKLNSILSDFTEASDMLLNSNKSKLYFFNTPPPIQHHISRLLGIPRSSLPSNYLGVPLTGAVASTISWDRSQTGYGTGLSDLSILPPGWFSSNQFCKHCPPIFSWLWRLPRKSSELSEPCSRIFSGTATN